MPHPIQRRITPPMMDNVPITGPFFKKGPNPFTMATIRANSSNPWPKTINGPVTNPLFIDSPIVIVKMGPGIRTPDKANINEMPPMVAKGKIIVFTHHLFSKIERRGYFHLPSKFGTKKKNLKHSYDKL